MAEIYVTYLIKNQNTDQESVPYLLPNIRQKRGWTLDITATTWGAATVKIYGSADGINWTQLSNDTGPVVFSAANSSVNLDYTYGMYLKAKIENADGSTLGINVAVA